MQAPKYFYIPFSLSFSKILDFFNCRVKFFANYLTKEAFFMETPQMKHGKDVHKAIENYILSGIQDSILNGYNIDMATKVRKLKNAIILVESQARFGFIDFFFKEACKLPQMSNKDPVSKEMCILTGVADLIVITGDTAVVVDWKTGKKPFTSMKSLTTWDANNEYMTLKQVVVNHSLQLQIYSLYVFLMCPTVNKVKGVLNYLKENYCVEEVYIREDIPKIQKLLYDIVMHISNEYNVFLENSPVDKVHALYGTRGTISPLCGFCNYGSKCWRYAIAKENKEIA